MRLVWLCFDSLFLSGFGGVDFDVVGLREW